MGETAVGWVVKVVVVVDDGAVVGATEVGWTLVVDTVEGATEFGLTEKGIV